MHFLVVMLRSSAPDRQSVSFVIAEKVWTASYHGMGLTGSLDRCALENAHYDIGAGLACHNANDNIRQASKTAVPETCVECQH